MKLSYSVDSKTKYTFDTSLTFLKKLNIYLQYNSTTSFLGIYQKK